MDNDFVKNLIYDNMKPIFVLLILVIIVTVFVVFSVVSFLRNIFGQYKEVEFGPFKLKGNFSKKGVKEELNSDSLKFNNTSISINTFIGIFETLLNAELKVIIKNCINISDKINKYRDEFSKYASERINIFTANLKHEYYSKLIKLVENLQASGRTEGGDTSQVVTNSRRLKDTKEFNFISEMLFTFEHKLATILKNIIDNEEIELNSSGTFNVPAYMIENVKSCIFTCEDPIKLNETRFDNKEFKKTILEVNENLGYDIQNLITDIFNSKKRMLEKQQREMTNMDDITNKSISNIINGVLSKMFNYIKVDNTPVAISNDK